MISLKRDQIILTSVLACTCDENSYLLLNCDLLHGAVSVPCGRASGRPEISFTQCCLSQATPRPPIPPTQNQAGRMPLAVGERKAAMGHTPACPMALTPRAAGLTGCVWMWIIAQWDTGHQTVGKQMPCSASWGTACLKA